MLTGKQRSYLKSLAHDLDATVYIGKEDLSDNVIAEIDRYISVHELCKVKIQESSELDPKETANKVAEMLKADFVQAIGRKFVLYRCAVKDTDRNIVLPK